MAVNGPCCVEWPIIAISAESDSIFVYSYDTDSCLSAVSVHDEHFLRLPICIHIKNNMTAKTSCDELCCMIDRFLQSADLFLLSLFDLLLKILVYCIRSITKSDCVVSFHKDIKIRLDHSCRKIHSKL